MTGENDNFCNSQDCNDPTENKNYGNCLICRNAFHYACVGVKSKSNFVCKTCAGAVTNIGRLSKIADDLQSTCTAKFDDLKTRLDQKNHECNEMKRQLDMLKKEVTELRKCKCVCQKKDGKTMSDESTVPTTSPHLILADSILRDVDKQKLIDTSLVSLPGAKIATLREKLGNYHGSTLESVTFHVATNDLDSIKDNPDKLDDIVSEYKGMIEDCKRLTSSVIVSSVCPRMDDVGELVEPFNNALKELCDDDHVTYIDHSCNFKLGDGKINDGYIWKNGPHLTRPGVNRLVRNLNIRTRAGILDVTRPHVRHNYGTNSSSKSDRPNRNTISSTSADDVVINHDGCKRCNERGHNVERCRHFHPVKCNTCHMRGHKSKHHRRTQETSQDCWAAAANFLIDDNCENELFLPHDVLENGDINCTSNYTLNENDNVLLPNGSSVGPINGSCHYSESYIASDVNDITDINECVVY